MTWGPASPPGPSLSRGREEGIPSHSSSFPWGLRTSEVDLFQPSPQIPDLQTHKLPHWKDLGDYLVSNPLSFVAKIPPGQGLLNSQTCKGGSLADRGPLAADAVPAFLTSPS